MINRPVPVGGPVRTTPRRSSRAAPLTGIVVGSVISVLLWAMLLALFFAIR
ncbi:MULTISPECIES: hypothetical protein [Sphingomonas]|uniref:Uncharacterized protein n=1 Tax=Sphingomonas kyungheensis TaxID=1069987 RepID=A0ABU8GZI6_9SPHN|nr:MULTISPECIES: hypothetical protein [unclassified Sphingomonas]EZP52662.1 hypothetical protein BW41_02425 [Sphingomonas sp. RIT328]